MSVTACPVCACEWLTVPTRCVCGYDFTSGSAQEAIRALTIQRRDADRLWMIGAALVATIPATLLFANAFVQGMLALPIILAFQVLTGISLLATGGRRTYRIRRQLGEARTLGQFPAARLLASGRPRTGSETNKGADPIPLPDRS